MVDMTTMPVIAILGCDPLFQVPMCFPHDSSGAQHVMIAADAVNALFVYFYVCMPDIQT